MKNYLSSIASEVMEKIKSASIINFKAREGKPALGLSIWRFALAIGAADLLTALNKGALKKKFAPTALSFFVAVGAIFFSTPPS